MSDINESTRLHFGHESNQSPGGRVAVPARKNGGVSTNEDLMKTIVMDEVRNSAKKLKVAFMGQMELRLNQMMDDVVNSMEQSDVFLQTSMMSMSSSAQDKRASLTGKLPEKEFRSRPSPLTELLQVEHFKTIHHIFVSTLALFMINIFIMDLLKTGSVDLGFGNLVWAFGDLEIPLCLLAGMHFIAIVIVYPAFYLWATHRQDFKADQRKAVDYAALGFFIAFVGLFIYIPAVILWKNPLAPGSGAAVTIEQCRLLMKIYGFVRSNVPRALNFPDSKLIVAGGSVQVQKTSGIDGPSKENVDPQPSRELFDETLRRRNGTTTTGNIQRNDAPNSGIGSAGVNQLSQKRKLSKRESWISFTWDDEDTPCPDYSKYLYYLFAPTLIYRNFYPRTNRVRWHFVCSNIGQCIGCIIYANFIISRYCSSTISQFGLKPINLTQLLEIIFHLMLPGILCMILGFFLLLHAWQNAFAEMLCFADRLFYKDWWNCSSFSSYYKTWNVLVHDWLYTYVFKDACELGLGKKWKFIPTTLVFLLSSMFHEYILSFTFNFFFPVLLTLFGGFGFAFVFIKNRKSALGNIAMWMALIVGTGIIFTFYGIECFARRNCPLTDITAWDFFKPRALSCDAIVWSFS